MADRVVIYLVALLVLAGVGWQINHWRVKAERLEVVEKEYAQYKAGREATDRTRAELSKAAEKDREELEKYRAKYNVRVVRLCDNPVSATPRPGPGDVQDQGGSGGVPEGTRPDIGPRLYANTYRAEEVNKELRMCRAWVCKAKPEAPGCR